MLVIREATLEDAEQKGHVHYQSWQETYTGLMNENFLKNMKLESCINIARKYPTNTLVAVINDIIVGFACYGVCKEDRMENYGELYALYVLKEFQKQGIGKKLLEACIQKLNGFHQFCLWVLDTNYAAIEFYHKQGFQFNGDTKQEVLITPITELRMIKYISNYVT